MDKLNDIKLGSNVETPICDNEPLMNYKRRNDERVVPSGEELMDKNFYVGIWSYIQVKSKCNHLDGYRYISEKDLSPTKISSAICNLSKNKESNQFTNKAVDRKSITEKIKYLKEKKYILEKVDGNIVGEGYTGTYYRIKNENAFKYYIVLENEFLESLYAGLSQDALKLYFLYYSFVQDDKDSKCYLNQDEILKRIGLSKSGSNYKKLRYLNRQLQELGLIRIYKRLCINECGKKFREKNITIVHNYWHTSYYINLKEKKTTCDKYTYEYIEL